MVGDWLDFIGQWAEWPEYVAATFGLLVILGLSIDDSSLYSEKSDAATRVMVAIGGGPFLIAGLWLFCVGVEWLLTWEGTKFSGWLLKQITQR